jgi:glycosyltransferase involved in cell wall biosynthesis
VVRHETEAVAEAVKEVLSNSELRNRLSEGGRTAASGLGWEEPVYLMERIYADLAARRQVGRQSADKD